MNTVTQPEYEHMSWHQRQRLNLSLKTEIASRIHQLERAAAITDELNTDGTSHIRSRPLTSESQFIAKALMEFLPPDPDAAEHRAALSREVNDYTINRAKRKAA